MNHLICNSSGYCGIYVTKSSNAADEVFTTRVNLYRSVINQNNGGNFDGVRVDCIASGYSGYDKIKIKMKKGNVRILGLGFTKEQDRPVVGMSCVHSDNVTGDPASLSDTRL